MSNGESPDSPPSFEDVFRSDDAEQRIYGTALRTREPTTASAIANAADCDPKTARRHLGWFSGLGIATHHDSHSVTYERNDAYFEWRRINRLATDHSVGDFQQRVQELGSRIGGYKDMYGAPTPTAVDIVAIAQSSDNRTIDDMYNDLGDWATARDERVRYEHACQQRARNDCQEK